MNVGIIARLWIYKPPRLAVDLAVWDALLLLEAFRENGNLDSRIAQSGVILNE